ncbi:MAG: tRNA (adenosine(37)-N6)-dimethylallyltransferase MiaA [Erysipelotrichaceae bacterium]|nr:tRNA (adenosine(37)-N6)-dimethylallyltransferase MiaA [Erysipelotrichaceae bacterium]
MKKVLVIAGPTAVGKTSFSIDLAKRLNCEIISGDSIQVYKGFDIGSGKVTEEEKEGIVHHLIDIRDPKDSYSAADFQKMAREIIDRTEGISMICGGTGLYLKSCLYDYTFNEESGMYANEDLEKLSNEELWQKLLETDPAQAEKLHPNNRRRVMRTITIAERSGRRQSEIEADQKHEMIYDTFIAGCTMERSKLYERINRRVEMMFEAGLKEEVASLLDQGITFDDPAMKGIGYREWAGYFRGNMSAEEVKEEIQKHSRQFAKRQYTWLNHQMPVHWFDISDEDEYQKMIGEIMDWSRL